jgi:DNA-binding transcriptional ArsR family regulator
MPRAPTTTDAFSAIGEPRRRQLIDLLARRGALSVGAVVVAVGLPQPAVSKHLGVLRTVGIISVARDGRHRVYRLNPEKLRPVYDWARSFEPFWSHQLERIKERAEREASKRSSLLTHPNREKGST